MKNGELLVGAAKAFDVLGQQHERNYLAKLKNEGRSVVEIAADDSWEEAAARTVEAVRSGVEVVYQPGFLVRDDGEGASDSRGVEEGRHDKLKHIGHSDWYGRADFLVRVERPSALGEFSYEVVETKLARSTKVRAIIQLCFYSDLLSRIQGVVPEYMHVVLGGGAKPERFLVQQYLAFFRKIKHDFVEAQKTLAAADLHEGQNETYPKPVEHCGIGDWSTVCDAQWRTDDHLSLVANITRNQRQVLVAHGVETVAALAKMPVPPEPKVEGIKDQAFANLHMQARLQIQGREEKRYVHELLVPFETEKGLCSLPSPSAGDVFLDFEGDQFAFDSGLEYLFGVVTVERRGDAETRGHGEGASGRVGEGEIRYVAIWALNPAEEEDAFEKFIRMLMERRREFPDMHVYHYGSYEKTAIKRMAGQHSTCVDEVDELLRGEVLVDMLRAVRQGLKASVESYSIKKLEPLYQYKRDVNLPEPVAR